jgi:hypothetical protein
MKKILLLLFISFSCSCLKAQQYEYGVPFDSLLNTQYFFGGPGCTGGPLTLTLDSSLYNYVSGIQFIFICDTVLAPPWAPVIQPGDTVIIDADHPQFAPPSGYPGFGGHFKLVGIPDSVGQTYPCSFEWIECACACPDILIRASQQDSSTCFVNPFSGLKESRTQKDFILYPNPANSELWIGNINGNAIIHVYDIYGRLVLEKETSTAIDINGLPPGLYTCMAEQKGRPIFAKFTIER